MNRKRARALRGRVSQGGCDASHANRARKDSTEEQGGEVRNETRDETGRDEMRQDRRRAEREMRDKERGSGTRVKSKSGEGERGTERGVLSRSERKRGECRTCRRTMPGIQAEGWAAN